MLLLGLVVGLIASVALAGAAFLLSTGASAADRTCAIGERVIEGQIEEREDARRTYTQARAQGRKATLLEMAPRYDCKK